MNIQSFLEHHGIVRNPFAEEDAQTDQVFKEHCIANAYHPIWDKVYGDPKEPSTSIVFGPKGSGKTAMRLQIDRHLRRFNEEHAGSRVFLIRYDDFNPFLDHFCERLGKRTTRKPEKVLDAWRLWDHMDAILCLGVTDLVDRILDPHSGSDRELGHEGIRVLDRTAARDLLMLATAYDQSTDSTFMSRWNRLRKQLHYSNVSTLWPWCLAIASLIGSLILVGWLFVRGGGESGTELANAAGEAAEAAGPSAKLLWLIPILTLIGSLPFLLRWTKMQWAAMGIHRHVRVGKRETASLRKALLAIPPSELASQPLPRYDRTDDRYELLHKFQAILKRLGFSGIMVLMDRVDEPHLLGGKPELMQRFVWPMLDNKLLKHPGIGFKLFLPQELHRDIERETREFHERARMDKQNVIPSFAWTGEAMYDLARARMHACAAEGRSPEPKELFAGVDYDRLLTSFQSLQVPRHLFRFLYRVLVEHCNRHTDSDPVFQIDERTFESILAVYQREKDYV
ncbi:MAG: hypothetical protein AAF958_00340 [Planctomycetota bacterium]